MASKKRVPVRKSGLGEIELEVTAIKGRSVPPSEDDKLEQIRAWLASLNELPDHSVILDPEKVRELRRILE